MGGNQSHSEEADEKPQVASEGDHYSLDGLDEKRTMTIESLPVEVLAICLSYTGKYLPKAMLTCRKFRRAAEEYDYMMNVIPVESLQMAKDFDAIDSLRIQINQHPKRGFIHSNKMILWCKMDEAMKYIRFYQPENLSIVGFYRGVDEMKNHLTNSWKRGITSVTIIGRTSLDMLSIFPNLDEVAYDPADDSSSVMTEICTYVPHIHHLRFENHVGENDSSLDVLIEKLNKSSKGIDSLLMLGSTVSIKAVIKFIETAKFADGILLVMSVKDYVFIINNGEGRIVGYRKGPAHHEFKKWIQNHESDGSLQKTRVINCPAGIIHFRYRNVVVNLMLIGEGLNYIVTEAEFLR